MGRSDERIGTTLAGRYRLERALGSGGMGVVYAGRHLESDRRVAVKVLRAEMVHVGDLLERFFQEAETAAALEHPNVVEVLEMAADDEGNVFLVLELLEGESLLDRLVRERRLSPAETLRVLLPVIDALEAAHELKVIHRDLKPANIFLSRDSQGTEVPKLLDFGIAKLLEGTAIHTATGSLVGTPGYMSPEQLRGVRELTPASDVWGMGVLLFRSLVGRLPFELDPNPTTMVMNILMSETPRVRELAPEITRGIASAVDLALKHSPETRHRDMRELREALLDGADSDGIRIHTRVSKLPLGVI